ncbi:MAG: hypothetical protein ACE37I_01770 [Rubinisphaera brasiliensis]|uniref:hypothetical protein n=1 Tax=Rubinisphaera brasiliensis TaxID=119 RepID=UPI003918826D
MKEADTAVEEPVEEESADAVAPAEEAGDRNRKLKCHDETDDAIPVDDDDEAEEESRRRRVALGLTSKLFIRQSSAR